MCLVEHLMFQELAADWKEAVELRQMAQNEFVSVDLCQYG
jgi:hypothetical protein